MCHHCERMEQLMNDMGAPAHAAAEAAHGWAPTAGQPHWRPDGDEPAPFAR